MAFAFADGANELTSTGDWICFVSLPSQYSVHEEFFFNLFSSNKPIQGHKLQRLFCRQNETRTCALASVCFGFQVFGGDKFALRLWQQPTCCVLSEVHQANWLKRSHAHYSLFFLKAAGGRVFLQSWRCSDAIRVSASTSHSGLPYNSKADHLTGFQEWCVATNKYRLWRKLLFCPLWGERSSVCPEWSTLTCWRGDDLVMLYLFRATRLAYCPSPFDLQHTLVFNVWAAASG